MIKTIVLDLDGTVYKGNQLIDGAAEAIDNMHKQGINVVFCTNNSSNMPRTISKKLYNLGIKNSEEEVITSGKLAINYVKKKKLKNIYVSGTDELKQGFEEAGIKICNIEETEILIIGMDNNYNYEKITKGMRAAINSKTIIICNEDRNFEKENGLFPGNGAMVSSILYCSNRSADVIIGKPNNLMLEYIINKYNSRKNEILVIGDSIESDGQMANKSGCGFIHITNEIKNRNEIKSLKETVEWDWTNYNYIEK